VKAIAPGATPSNQCPTHSAVALARAISRAIISTQPQKARRNKCASNKVKNPVHKIIVLIALIAD
jgi:hypothetical protein